MDYLFFIYGSFYVIGRLFGMFNGLQDFGALLYTDPTLFYILGRFFVGVIFGTGTVWLVWKETRKYFSESIAFWAALCLAVHYYHVLHSHFIYADVPVSFFTTLMFFQLFKMTRKSDFKEYIKFGFFTGCAAATKYTALYFAPILIAPYFIFYGMGGFRLDNIIKIILSALFCIVIFVIICPYSILR